MAECYCGSGKNYEECCEPIIKGKKAAVTAEELMRARYSAFAAHEIDFIMDTVVPDQTGNMTRDAVERWSKKTDWKKLEITGTEAGGKNDETGSVDFKAFSMLDGVMQCHHEHAMFKKINGKWFFEDGTQIMPEQVRRETPKVGRNDPCPCGSGKKYKKCCGKDA